MPWREVSGEGIRLGQMCQIVEEVQAPGLVVSGALKLTETYGAALLAEEMESVCAYLANLRADKGREDGLDALTRSMVQLPIYVERLIGGNGYPAGQTSFCTCACYRNCSSDSGA